jgi:putative phosphoesterase
MAEAEDMVRVGLIADVHGNLAALEAVLAALDTERPDRVVCLGDVAAMGPQPRETLHRLRELACPVVMGNADAELLDPSLMPEATEDARRFKAMTRWAADQLDDADRAFIRGFQPTVEITLDPAIRLLCCHGSPRSFDDAITASTSEEELAPMLAGASATVIAGGHTHTRLLRTLPGRTLVNPGSVGLAYEFLPDGSVRVPPWAEFALLTEGPAAR